MKVTSKPRNKPVPSDPLSTNDNIDPNARLFAATNRLREVSERQIIEVRKYKNAISTLNNTVKQLENNWTAYDRAIGRVNVNPLRARAARLGMMMDGGLEAI